MAQLEDEAALFLWQRAAFMGSNSDSSGTSGSRATADSLRLRLGQLEYLHYKEKLQGRNSPHVHHLMESHLHSYAAAVDDQGGLNNYAAAVQVLAAGQKNESKDWKSALTLESAMGTPEVKALLKEGEPSWHATLRDGTASRGSGRGGVSHPLSTQGSSNTGSALRKSPPPPSPGAYGVFSPRHKFGNPSHQFPYSTTGSSGSTPTAVAGPTSRAAHSSNRGVRVSPPREQPSGRERSWSARSTADSGGRHREARGGGRGFEREERGPRRKRPRAEGGTEVEGKAGPGGGVEEEEEERETRPFITARDQYVINQRKKFGAGGGGCEGRGLNGGSYGLSKKSLGARRAGTGSKFIPPVKRDQEDGVSEAIASRVFRGPSGGGGSTGGGNSSTRLPPELEGDARLRNIEPRMVELIMNEIIDHGAPVQWEDVAGLQFAKATIKEIVVWPMLRPDIFTGLRGPPKGILLFGPPGTGKTLIGKCIASQVNATFFSISASSLTSKWVGEGEKMVRALFAVACCYQPAVIFIDEIDSLLSQRSDSEHESSRRIKTEFLVQLDGAATNADDRQLVIGATNRPQEIDEAARRRLVKRLYIPLPDTTARRQIVTNLMREQPFSLSEEEIGSVCEQSEGYSGADMANVCREAAYGPIREAAESIQHIVAEEMRPVLYKDFEAALQIIRPSVSEKDLELYEEWNRQFGCGYHSTRKQTSLNMRQ